MRVLLFVLAIFAVTAAIGTPAQAQNYPWCAQYSGLGGTNCGFTSFQQCMAHARRHGRLLQRQYAIRSSRRAAGAARPQAVVIVG